MKHQPSKITITCLSQIKGQECAKRAMEIAASGYHSLLIVGPTGQGKTAMLSLQHGLMGTELNVDQVPWNEIHEENIDLAHVAEMHDVVITIGMLSAPDWFLPAPAEPTELVRARVEKVQKSYRRMEIDSKGSELFMLAYRKMHLTPRKADAITRVANTIAIMEDPSKRSRKVRYIHRVHLANALSYVWQPGVDSKDPVE